MGLQSGDKHPILLLKQLDFLKGVKIIKPCLTYTPQPNLNQLLQRNFSVCSFLIAAARLSYLLEEELPMNVFLHGHP